MKRSRFSEEQVAYALRQVEAGNPVGDVCRELGVSEARFYAWKKKYAHLGVSELRRLRQLEDENGRLKRLMADLTFDKHMLCRRRCEKTSEARAPSGAGPVVSGDIPGQLRASLSVGPVQSSRLYRRSRARDQSALRLRIRDIAHAPPRFGGLRIWVLLRREVWLVNRKRVRRLYRPDGLQVRMRVRRCKHMALHRGPARCRRGRPSAGAWTLCMMPSRTGARSGCSRSSISGVATPGPGGRGAHVGVDRRPSPGSRAGRLAEAAVDHGTEFQSRALEDWAYRRGVQLDFIRPSKPD